MIVCEVAGGRFACAIRLWLVPKHCNHNSETHAQSSLLLWLLWSSSSLRKKQRYRVCMGMVVLAHLHQNTNRLLLLLLLCHTTMLLLLWLVYQHTTIPTRTERHSPKSSLHWPKTKNKKIVKRMHFEQKIHLLYKRRIDCTYQRATPQLGCPN